MSVSRLTEKHEVSLATLEAVESLRVPET